MNLTKEERRVVSDYISMKIGNNEWEQRLPFKYIDQSEIDRFFNTSDELIFSHLMKKVEMCEGRFYIYTFEGDNWTTDDLESVEDIYTKRFIENYEHVVKVLPIFKRQELDDYVQRGKERLLKHQVSKIKEVEEEPAKIEVNEPKKEELKEEPKKEPESDKNKLMKEILDSGDLAKLEENKEKLSLNEFKYLDHEIRKNKKKIPTR